MDSNRKGILIVDDDLDLARMISNFLERCGFNPMIAPDGNTAIRKITSEFPDLVLLDLNLPDLNGKEVLKRIREVKEDIAVVIITGYGGEQVAVDLMKAGALDFLSKPIDLPILLKSVENTLKIRDAQTEDRQLKRYSSLERLFPFLAHELRNPLHAIAGAIAIIQRRCDLNDEILKQSIHIIQEEVVNLNGFVQECLDFVRSPVESHFSEFEIKDVLSVVLNVTRQMYEDLYLKIRIKFEADLSLPKVYANYDEIKQAFINIIKNAFEALNEGGELIIKTGFKSDPLPGLIKICFIDNGHGIKKENMKNLFEPFFTTKHRGTGLGLAISRRIITERHNGKISVFSEEGKGTSVIVELPVSQNMGFMGGER